FFHNTVIGGANAAGQGISGNSGQPLTNTVSRNNLFAIWKPHWDVIDEAGGSGNDFDYDLYNGKLSTYRGAEKHGIEGSQPSAGIDRGVRIANFNDNYVGAAPDIGAQESGAVTLRFGLDAPERREATTLRTARKQ